MPEIQIRVEQGVGRITLDRPRALNALTLGMIQAIDAALVAWADDPAVRFVLLDGAGQRGLCAGGDIRAMHDAARAGDDAAIDAFFRAEYRLNARIARFSKPYVALMDGIVMGGGIGVAAHGSHRIVTERSRLAMPETGIGFIPDVGATWLLARAPDHLGRHLALTGGAVGAADGILCGLADTFVASSRLPDLIRTVLTCASRESLDACIDDFATASPPGQLAEARSSLAECYAADTVEDVLARLRAHSDPVASQAAREIATRSPLSLKIAWRALAEAPGLGALEACLAREFRLALACTRNADFVEGVRAAVIDKDRAPRWNPATLAEVTPDLVQRCFAEPASPPGLWN